MSYTPLMSEFPEDKKDHLPPIDEQDVELRVGQPAPRRACFWSRFRCCKANGEAKPRSPIRRAIRWFLTIMLLLGVVGFFSAKHHIHKQMKMHPIICVPVTGTSATVELPLASFRTHLRLHPSLSSNDVKITHSDKVANHTVSIAFELPKDLELRTAEDDAKYFSCHIAGPKFVSLGVYAKHKKDGEENSKHHHLNHHGKDHPHPPHRPHGHPHFVKATSTTVTLPAVEAGHPRSISFGGPPMGWWGKRKFGHGCMRKKIKMAIAKASREEKIAKLKAIESN